MKNVDQIVGGKFWPDLRPSYVTLATHVVSIVVKSLATKFPFSFKLTGN